MTTPTDDPPESETALEPDAVARAKKIRDRFRCQQVERAFAERTLMDTLAMCMLADLAVQKFVPPPPSRWQRAKQWLASQWKRVRP